MIEKSCGTTTCCQAWSSKAFRSAPLTSPAWKRQSCDRLRTSAQAGAAASAMSNTAAKRRCVAAIVLMLALPSDVANADDLASSDTPCGTRRLHPETRHALELHPAGSERLSGAVMDEEA